MSETVDNHLSVVNSCISNNAISFNIAYENNECVVSYNKYMKKSDINSKENDADFDQNKALNMKILYLKVLYLHDYLNSLCNVDSCDIYNTDQVLRSMTKYIHSSQMKQIKSKYNLRSRKAVESVNPTTQQVGHANSHPTMGYWGKYMQKIGSILDIPVSCSYNASMYPDLLLNQPKIQCLLSIETTINRMQMLLVQQSRLQKDTEYPEILGILIECSQQTNTDMLYHHPSYLWIQPQDSSQDSSKDSSLCHVITIKDHMVDGPSDGGSVSNPETSSKYSNVRSDCIHVTTDVPWSDVPGMISRCYDSDQTVKEAGSETETQRLFTTHYTSPLSDFIECRICVVCKSQNDNANSGKKQRKHSSPVSTVGAHQHSEFYQYLKQVRKQEKLQTIEEIKSVYAYLETLSTSTAMGANESSVREGDQDSGDNEKEGALEGSVVQSKVKSEAIPDKPEVYGGSDSLKVDDLELSSPQAVSARWQNKSVDRLNKVRDSGGALKGHGGNSVSSGELGVMGMVSSGHMPLPPSVRSSKADSFGGVEPTPPHPTEDPVIPDNAVRRSGSGHSTSIGSGSTARHNTDDDIRCTMSNAGVSDFDMCGSTAIDRSIHSSTRLGNPLGDRDPPLTDSVRESSDSQAWSNPHMSKLNSGLYNELVRSQTGEELDLYSIRVLHAMYAQAVEDMSDEDESSEPDFMRLGEPMSTTCAEQSVSIPDGVNGDTQVALSISGWEAVEGVHSAVGDAPSCSPGNAVVMDKDEAFPDDVTQMVPSCSPGNVVVMDKDEAFPDDVTQMVPSCSPGKAGMTNENTESPDNATEDAAVASPCNCEKAISGESGATPESVRSDNKAHILDFPGAGVDPIVEQVPSESLMCRTNSRSADNGALCETDMFALDPNVTCGTDELLYGGSSADSEVDRDPKLEKHHRYSSNNACSDSKMSLLDTMGSYNVDMGDQFFWYLTGKEEDSFSSSSDESEGGVAATCREIYTDVDAVEAAGMEDNVSGGEVFDDLTVGGDDDTAPLSVSVDRVGGSVTSHVGSEVFDDLTAGGDDDTAPLSVSVDRVGGSVTSHVGNEVLDKYLWEDQDSTLAKRTRIEVTELQETGVVAANTEKWDSIRKQLNGIRSGLSGSSLFERNNRTGISREIRMEIGDRVLTALYDVPDENEVIPEAIDEKESVPLSNAFVPDKRLVSSRKNSLLREEKIPAPVSVAVEESSKHAVNETNKLFWVGVSENSKSKAKPKVKVKPPPLPVVAPPTPPQDFCDSNFPRGNCNVHSGHETAVNSHGPLEGHRTESRGQRLNNLPDRSCRTNVTDARDTSVAVERGLNRCVNEPNSNSKIPIRFSEKIPLVEKNVASSPKAEAYTYVFSSGTSSNVPSVKNALTKVCLAAKVLERVQSEVLYIIDNTATNGLTISVQMSDNNSPLPALSDISIIDRHSYEGVSIGGESHHCIPLKQYIIVLRQTHALTFQGLYGVVYCQKVPVEGPSPDGTNWNAGSGALKSPSFLIRLYGKGPRVLHCMNNSKNRIKVFYKYNTGSRMFQPISNCKGISIAIDAICLG